MDNYILSNGVAVPKIGFGTYKSLDSGDESVIVNAVAAGYRHFDTAAFYKNEEGIGRGLKASGVGRKELFLTSKVWRDDLGYEAALRSFDASLKRLQTDYLDLFLIHWPMQNPVSGWREGTWKQTVIDTWRALERLYEEGSVRAIGVSNFLPHHLDVLLENGSIMPMVDQLEYHPGYTQQYAVEYAQKQGLIVEAWSPLGRGRVMREPFLQELAQKYQVSVAQICLRFALQNEILPLPKASAPERMRQNLDVFDFELSQEDMHRLLSLPQIGWSGEHPDRETVQPEIGHPQSPDAG